jgi:hypothetical protein
LRQFSDKLKNKKDVIVLWGGMFVLFSVLGLAFSSKPQQPQLAGTIQTVVVGPANKNNDTVAVITMNVMNAGTMQSIVKNWKVTATINGNNYDGLFGMMPQTVSFNTTGNRGE